MVAFHFNEYATSNFKWDELRCKGCDGTCTYSVDGKQLVNITPSALEKLQDLRTFIQKPLIITSATRCPTHNARVGGAPLSRHRATENRSSIAFDIALTSVPKSVLVAASRTAGFGGIGENYKSFVHVDDRGTTARW